MEFKQKSSFLIGLFLTVFFLVCCLLPQMSFAGPTVPPSWYQKLSGTKRFVMVLDGTAVLDKETGLVWEKEPAGAGVKWVDTFATCAHKVLGARKGWRVPTVEELNSLVDTTNIYPSLPTGHPFNNIQHTLYWSSDSGIENSNYAWYVDFGTGNAGLEIKPNSRFIWCVRGGSN
ncbi:MAG: DUF1566 domain-containing protein [Thermodesulfovibrionales bacterium]|nr:DUF1566 domain-containing protein [Thermodesulfovibrionales bacterium]